MALQDRLFTSHGALRRKRLAFVVAVAAVYGCVVLGMNGLCFEPRKDEVHFWPTSLEFSKRAVPTADDLRSYHELNTPLPFLMFGWLERGFHGGITAGRFLNLGLSVIIVCIIGMPKDANGWRSVLAAIGLVAFPYYLGVSIHLYTDSLAAFFVLLGLVAHRQSRQWVAAVCFVLAISSRQYMVAFPAAVLLFEVSASWPRLLDPASLKRWLPHLVASMSILGWFALFGGPAPRAALESQPVATASTLRLFPSHGLYFLSCVGAYFVIPELVLFRWQPLRERATQKRNVAIAIGLGVLFLAFPTLGNVDYPIPTMGFLDKAARSVLSDPLRVCVFYFLALVACVRFSRVDLDGVLVYVNALIMLKAHIGWDKYVLPLLVALWYLRARETRDASDISIEGVHPRDGAAELDASR